MLMKGNAEKIWKQLDVVIRVEDSNECSGIGNGFLRIGVVVNVKKSLVVGFWVPRWGKDRIWADVKCERLADFCFNCGWLGHVKKFCDVEVFLRGKGKYGSHLRASLRGFKMIGRRVMYRDFDKENVGCVRQRGDVIRDRSSRVVLGEVYEGSLGNSLSKDIVFEGYVDTSGLGFVVDNKNVVEAMMNKSQGSWRRKRRLLVRK
ncbi:hypothetical protein PTKIN_Ptkin09bG0159300 [Pterospermum kingtungense]